MAGNKRVRKSSKARDAQDLLGSEGGRGVEVPVRRPRSLKDKERELQGQLHRLEVEIAATSRVFADERRRRNENELPPPEGYRSRAKGKRLTLAQAREKRRVFYMQVVEFAVTLLLMVGACAWLYQWWLSRG